MKYYNYALLLPLAVLAGCNGQLDEPMNPRQNDNPLVTTNISHARFPTRESPVGVTLGESVRGAPIDLLTFGAGDVGVLVLGGIHGDETTSVDLTSNLIELLRSEPAHTAGRRVGVIRIANPDGYAAKKRVNAHRIDLNRNFPASNFGTSRAARGGSTPTSEPETRAILSAIDQIKPRLIISIHSIDAGRQCNNYDGPAEQIAALMSKFNGYPATATIGYPTPGSMGSYCGIDRQIPMITLELPRSTPGVEAWRINREALLAAIAAAR